MSISTHHSQPQDLQSLVQHILERRGLLAQSIGRLSEGVTDEDEADLQALSDDLKLLAGRLTTTLADVRANAAPVADRELTLIMSALADLAR